MEQGNDVKTMKEKAEAVQSIVAEVPGLEEAFRYAIEVTRKQGGEIIAAPGLDGKDESAFQELCLEAGLSLVTENLRESVGKIQTGFTMAEYGIAETATLVVPSAAEDTRIATMLSETHVAVLPKSRIRPDALSLAGELKKYMKSPPSYLAFISGASRTADIERVLTIGVHGPQELHILILED